VQLQKKGSQIVVLRGKAVYVTTAPHLHREISAVHYPIAISGYNVPPAPHAAFGTPELARCAAESIGNCNALLPANHGPVAIGPDLNTAFALAEEIYRVAQNYYQTKSIGKPVALSQKEMSNAIEKLRTYGKKGLTIPNNA